MTKKLFKVDVCRISYGFASFEVEAYNEAEAKRRADEEAGNHEFSEKSAEYKVNSCTEVK